MMVWSDKQDASGIVKELFRQLEDLDKEEALCYFASFLPIPVREKVKNQVLNRTGILNTIFPAAILGKGGKLIAKSRPVKKPDGTILELEGVKESLDEDLIFALNTIFCSKFGFNMRNNVAHGMLDDQAFQSFKALYIWWFALKFCYLFCGKLQEENRSKINKKLKPLMEKNKKL